MTRDRVSGFRHPTVRNTVADGLSLIAGADAAKVFRSNLLPEKDGFELTDLRWRIRAGALFDAGTASVFFGSVWLGREFMAQRSGQRVGALTVNLRF